jgi:hypothetical protein
VIPSSRSGIAFAEPEPSFICELHTDRSCRVARRLEAMMFGLGEAQCLLSEPPNGAGRQGVGRSWPDSGMTAVATVVGRSYPSFPFNLLSSRHIGEPLREEGWWLINRLTEKFEPRAAGLGLEGETPSTPLGCSPDEGEGSGADEEHLAPEDLGRIHGDDGSGDRRRIPARAINSEAWWRLS